MKWAVPILIFMLVLGGCGGDELSQGGGTPDQPTTLSGTYQGSFTSASPKHTGPFLMNIDDPDVNGSLTDNGSSPVSKEGFSGALQDNFGNFVGQINTPQGTFPMLARFAFDNSGHLTGPVAIKMSNGTTHLMVDLAVVEGPPRHPK